MNKHKLLTITVIFLLLLNLLQMAFIAIGNSDVLKSKETPREIIIERLNFDKNQINGYDTLILENQQRIKFANRRIELLKCELYKTLNNDTAHIKEHIIKEILDVRARIERINYEHFESIKNLCRPEQNEAFNQLTNDLDRIFSTYQKKVSRTKD
jgi:protein CpxP